MKSRIPLASALGIFVFLGLCASACWLLTARWSASPVELESIRSPADDTRWNPAAPQLQVNAPADWRQLQAEQEAILHRAEWTDASHRRARIPIEDAMRLVSEGRKP